MDIYNKLSSNRAELIMIGCAGLSLVDISL